LYNDISKPRSDAIHEVPPQQQAQPAPTAK
jgi:hypothetical protein